MKKILLVSLLLAVSGCDSVYAGSYPTQTTCNQSGQCTQTQVVRGSDSTQPNGFSLDVKPTPSCTSSQTIYRDVPATYYPQTSELVIPMVNVIGSPVIFRNVKIGFDNVEHKLNVVSFE